MADLIPEVRVNKNGVPVTKHVRPSNAARKPGNSIPPVNGSAKPTASKAEELREMIRSHGSGFSDFVDNRVARSEERLSPKLYAKMMGTFNPETLDRMDDHLKGVANTTFVQRSLMSCMAVRNFALINNMGVLLDQFDESERQDARFIVAGLNEYTYPPRDYSYSGEDEMEGPRAVIKATKELYRDYITNNHYKKTPSTHIDSPLLIELIMERPEDVDQIISLVNERKLKVYESEDIEMLTELIDRGPSALLNGNL